MKVIRVDRLPAERIVECPNGGFTSHRMLLASDGTGYTVTKTVIPPRGKQFWHYKNHIESCYCVSGVGELTNAETGETFIILPGTLYVLDNHDPHYFEAIETVTLVCVFNPPLNGREVHKEDGSYE